MTDSEYSSIVVTGADAFDFLQNQLTNDLELLEETPVLLAAWCNPKGRVICIVRVRRTADGFELMLPAELAEHVVQRLTMFRFRAKVDFGIRPVTAGDFGVSGDVDAWMLANLRAGVAEIRRPLSEAFTPHMLNLDLLGAVNFDKGCYPGQEIVARTHYRGASRRRMLRFDSAAPVAAGDPVRDGDRKVGDVVNAIGTELLAVVPLDTKDAALTADGADLNRVPLPYLGD